MYKRAETKILVHFTHRKLLEVRENLNKTLSGRKNMNVFAPPDNTIRLDSGDICPDVDHSVVPQASPVCSFVLVPDIICSFAKQEEAVTSANKA